MKSTPSQRKLGRIELGLLKSQNEKTQVRFSFFFFFFSSRFFSFPTAQPIILGPSGMGGPDEHGITCNGQCSQASF
jgi:hypothetical protein